MSGAPRDDGRAFDPDIIDEHLERVLRASGSSLRYYSVPSIKQKMRAAMADAMLAARALSGQEKPE